MAQDNGQLDPAETMAMVFMGMLILGSGAGAALAARFLTPVQQPLLEYGVLVPATEAAFPLGETGLGVPLWAALGPGGPERSLPAKWGRAGPCLWFP